jgi:bifunctional non-homologous end joining protein LigD
LRNSKGATAVAAYSVRARAGGPVAVPLAWNELKDGVRSDSFNVGNVMERLRGLRSDPWRGFFESRQKLTRDMKRALGADG